MGSKIKIRKLELLNWPIHLVEWYSMLMPFYIYSIHKTETYLSTYQKGIQCHVLSLLSSDLPVNTANKKAKVKILLIINNFLSILWDTIRLYIATYIFEYLGSLLWQKGHFSNSIINGQSSYLNRKK